MSFRGEKKERESTNQKVFYYYDEELGIKQKSKVVYKNRDCTVHFPRGFEGGDKYRTIKKFTFIGFGLNLPIGVYKSAHYGYGFTKKLRPFATFLDEELDLLEVVIEKGGDTKIDTAVKKIYMSEDSLQKLHDAFDNIFKKNRSEVNAILEGLMFELFPNVQDEPETSYIPNTIATSLAMWGRSLDEFSTKDKEAILALFDQLSTHSDFLSDDSLSRTKEIVDIKYVRDTLEKFKEIQTLVTDGESLEGKWQEFLKSNSWIFSTIFAQPVILHRDEAYVGGKTIDNKNGKFSDFLIKNNLSNNVSFVEIKTHKTKLLEKTPYRGDDVFSASKHLSGCINQVLNQRDNFQKEFYQTKVKSKEDFETFNSRCVVLVGSLSDLTEKQKYAFELNRSNSRDVDIITFDELRQKIESLQSIMEKD